MSNDTDHQIARALFGFCVEMQRRVAATDWPSGWEWHMHPGTWIRVKSDTKAAEYITPSGARAASSSDDLLGCPVVLDAEMPLGVVELRCADSMTLPMAPA